MHHLCTVTACGSIAPLLWDHCDTCDVVSHTVPTVAPLGTCVSSCTLPPKAPATHLAPCVALSFLCMLRFALLQLTEVPLG